MGLCSDPDGFANDKFMAKEMKTEPLKVFSQREISCEVDTSTLCCWVSFSVCVENRLKVCNATSEFSIKDRSDKKGSSL
jgi:hypothetical protein